MNKPLFDLRELRLFATVAESGSFTEAARLLGMSQSALTRQIQALEGKLAQQLLSRTTRSVRLPPAGEFWLERSRQLLGQAEAAWEAFAERYEKSAPTVRVGVCRTVGLAHLPGFFHAFRRKHPNCQIRLEQGREGELIAELDACSLDVAIVTQPLSLPPGIEITHGFEDVFALIAPASEENPDLSRLDEWPMIRIDSQCTTGKLVSAWLAKRQVVAQAMMEFDNFDLIINSVALGLGCALVPRRSLAIYARNRKIRRFPLTGPPTRRLCALARAETNRPQIIQAFIDAILF